SFTAVSPPSRSFRTHQSSTLMGTQKVALPTPRRMIIASPTAAGRRSMTQITVSAAIDGKVADRAMLKHPFYQAWTEGRLTLETLRAYARQYFHHVEAFPRAVSAVHSICPDRNGRRMLAENLAEEEGIEAGKQ